jgi:hypothetical protein
MFDEDLRSARYRADGSASRETIDLTIELDRNVIFMSVQTHGI